MRCAAVGGQGDLLGLFPFEGGWVCGIVDFPITTLLQIFWSNSLVCCAVEHLGCCLSFFFIS